MHPGKIAVEQDDVVLIKPCLSKSPDAVERDVDRHPRVAEPGRDRLGQLLVILDHQHSHRQARVIVAGFGEVSAPRHVAETESRVQATPQRLTDIRWIASVEKTGSAPRWRP